MNKEVFFQTAHVYIWYLPGTALGGAIWTGYIPSNELREAFMKCTELLEEKKLQFWLADNRKMAAMSQQDLEWISMMTPQLLNKGLRKMATLVSEDIFHHMSIVDLIDEYSGKLTFQNHFFRNSKEALAWLGFAGEPYLLPHTQHI